MRKSLERNSDNLLRQDKNLLKDPIWFVNETQFERDENSLAIWCSKAGYQFMTSKEPPNRIDYLVLLGVLYLSQSNHWSLKVETTRHQLIKLGGLAMNSTSYKRVERSIERYIASYIKTENWYVPGKGYSTCMFNIISSAEFQKRKIVIYFTPAFIEKVSSSNFFQQMSLNTLRNISSPVSLRLYELLSSMFYGRTKWSICAHKMAEKIHINEKYASRIVYRIKGFLSTIRKKTDLKVYLKTEKKRRSSIILHFYTRAKPLEEVESKVEKILAPEITSDEVTKWIEEELSIQNKTKYREYILEKVNNGYAGSEELGFNRRLIKKWIDNIK